MIHLKTKAEIKVMQEGGKILAVILKKIAQEVRPGITTKELDKLARELVLFYNVKSGFLGYGGYPAALCTSVDDEVVHCVPSERVLKEGELVSLDMGIVYKGFNLDHAVTIPVLGSLSYTEWVKKNPELNHLLETTKAALSAGIKNAKPGNPVGMIGSAVQAIVETAGFGVVRELVGHGVGKSLHEEPHVPNFGSGSEGPKLKEGMVIAIEPMVTMGDWRLVGGKDNFTYRTKDGSRAAHFEHTVAITSGGPVVLTK
ncbi:MAG: type I methionyl aminopeptidase [Candidatus Paceibacterota bacterium]